MIALYFVEYHTLAVIHIIRTTAFLLLLFTIINLVCCNGDSFDTLFLINH